MEHRQVQAGTARHELRIRIHGREPARVRASVNIRVVLFVDSYQSLRYNRMPHHLTYLPPLSFGGGPGWGRGFDD